LFSTQKNFTTSYGIKSAKEVRFFKTGVHVLGLRDDGIGLPSKELIKKDFFLFKKRNVNLISIILAI